MPKPLVWVKIKTGEGTPSARLGHTLVEMDKDTYVMYGGLDVHSKLEGNILPSDKVYTLRITQKGEYVWTQTDCDGEEIPLARTNHSSCKIGKNEMFVFGGYYTSKMRFNDVHILKTGTSKKYTWTQPTNQKLGKNTPKNTESKIGAPEPRANHSATFVPNTVKVYVFGGQGGIGYSRKSFNDIHSYDVKSQYWSKIETNGNPPKERGGHTACLMPDGHRILIYGGWSGTTQHWNCYIFDTRTNDWIDLDTPTDVPRWNHCAVVVPCLPESKLFVFGGQRASYEEGQERQFGKLDNSVSFMELSKDLKGKKFSNVHINEQKEDQMPLPRENTVMIYDKIDQRVIIFGGWSGNYMNDIWELNISSITGPDYSISSIAPSLGPVTGGTQCEVTGDGFTQGKNYKVQFSTGKPGQYPIDVTARVLTFADQASRLICETPNFSDYGKGEAEVRIIADRGDPTLGYTKFTFFLNTSPKYTVSFGPGLITNNSTKVPTMFYVQAKNKNNENRTSGKDTFEIRAYYKDWEEFINDRDEKDKRLVERDIKVDEPKDYDNGLYKVTYSMPEEREVYVQVMTRGEDGVLSKVRGSPYVASFSHTADEDNNSFTGRRMVQYFKNQLDQINKNYEETKTGIAASDPSGTSTYETDVKALLNIKKNIIRIKNDRDKNLLDLEIAKQAFSQLQRTKNATQDETNLSSNLIGHIEKLSDKSEKAEVVIQPSMSKQRDLVKTEMEHFDKEVKDFYAALKRQGIYNFDYGYESALSVLKDNQEQYQIYNQRYLDYDYYCNMLYEEDERPNSLSTISKNLDLIKQEIDAMVQMWQHNEYCEKKFIEYLNLEFKETDAGAVYEEIKGTMTKVLQGFKKVDKKCSAFKEFMRKLKNWETFMQLIQELKKPAMYVDDDRHWNELREFLSTDISVEDSPKLEQFWNLDIFEMKTKEKIEETTIKAESEAKIEKQLAEVDKRWRVVEFERQLLQLKETKLELLKMNDEDTEKLEQDQLQIQNISANKFMAHFKDSVEEWQRNLALINDTVSLLSEVQKTWSFLINLFRYSDEVKKELPRETKDFAQIDSEVESLMKLSRRKDLNNSILKYCIEELDDNGTKVLNKLNNISTELAKCQKGLNNFIAEKRKVFPRFYFLTMEELLDILANGNNPIMLFKEKNYMSKIVQAADKLSMEESGNERPTIKSMNASVGKETVKFINDEKANLKGKVEIYLQDILSIVEKTLREAAKSTWAEYARGPMNEVAQEREKASPAKVEWIMKNYAQLVLLVSSSGWVRMTEDKFTKIQNGESDSMAKFLRDVIANLTALIKLVQGELDGPTRRKVMCLITMETHNRDIIDKLVVEKVRKADEFQWQSQLKFYYDDNKGYFYTRIADAKLDYGYEYLGNGARLVVTPLTDRIYVTATQALHLKMGCAPAGPAGTGKTETTKDLASAVGKACYVFNCSPEMNFESMGNIFKGLASSGCWGCFDEFNRLVPEVLSVCTVQFKSVTDAIKAKKKIFHMGEDEIHLDPTCGAFITMNPGYLGRSELPEGLKALFRPITVVVPDLELICENILMAEGFVSAKALARKFVTLYKLCKDLLSKQDHYDWGLRAIKSVLVVAGAFKRAESEIPENFLLFRALRDFNYPKIAQVDLGIFDGLLGDLFPGITIERKRNEKFEDIISRVTKESGLKDDPNFNLKVVQLGELLEIRHCVFVMGPPGSGKSTTWKILAKSNTADGNKTTTQDIDPKTISTKDLYGYTNMTTKEWKNGLLSHYMQYFSEETTDGKPKWIILDGDLDANWIESMNSVMDDNKLLTLANNGRIVVKDYMRLIFEIRDLKFATPATVSRAGILYISDDSGYQRKAYIDSWLSKMDKYDESLRQGIMELCDKYVEKTVAFLYKKCKFVTPVSFFGMTVAFCKLLQSQIKINMKFLVTEEKSVRTVSMIKLEHIFALSAVWAFGGSLTVKDTSDYRKNFSEWWKGEFNKPVKFKSKGTVFDYFVKMDDTKVDFEEWRSFMIRNEKDGDRPPAPAPVAASSKEAGSTPNPFEGVLAYVEYDGSVPMQNITVPIPETISIKLITKSLLYEDHPTLMIGNAGSGKTQLIKGLLREVKDAAKDNEYYYLGINFNYYTDATYLQTMLEQELVKQGTSYGPRKGSTSKLIYFIDDLNMPQLDQYNTQSAIALLRQHIDHSHWYDISKVIPIIKEIKRTLTIAAMNPTSGSFSVNPRYQRHFWTCSVSFPESSSLTIIYETFLRGHFSRFKPSVQEMTPQLIKAAISLHEKVCSQFKKTAINFHYEFNIRHISNIFAGILQAQPQNYSDVEKVIKLWFHESERIYADRLVESSHIKAYTESALEIIKKVFGKNVVQKHYQGENPEPLIFCHFPQGYQGDKVYDVSPFPDVVRNVKEALADHNEEKVEMNLVLFEDAIKHICRITRIISNTAGHALLVGVGGSGKQSLAKLSAFIKFYSTFSITVSKEYSMGDLKTDISALYNRAGIKDDPIMFMITDSHITDEKFLVYINDLLSSGEIADLYAEDEKAGIVDAMRSKIRGTNDEIFSGFIDKVRENLHVCLCFSPIGEAFRTRARRFPALVNSTVIDWFQPWPDAALEDVSRNFLSQVDLGDEKVRNAVIKFMPDSFKAVNEAAKEVFEKERRYIYNTPKSFLELIALYTNQLAKIRKTLIEDRENYDKGLRKLIKTKEDVAILNESLIVTTKMVEEKKAEADKVAEVVGAEKIKVEEENSKARVRKEECAKIKINVEAQQKSCQEDVDALQPMVEKALSKVKNLDPDKLKTIRTYKSPPPGIDKVFICIMYMFANVPGFTEGITLTKNNLPKNTSDWASILKEVLSRCDILVKNLQKFPEEIAKANVPEQNFNEIITKYLVDPEFNEKNISGKSQEAGAICAFVLNMVDYYKAMKEMIPKQNMLKRAVGELNQATEDLKIVEEKVAELNKALAKVQAELDKANADKDAAQAEADRCNKKLNLAQRLVSALMSEEIRWKLSIEELTAKLNVLVGDVLISSAFISYAGPFSKNFRAKLIHVEFKNYLTKKGIPMSPNLNVINMLVDEATIANWNNEGLPADDVSIENGAILTSSERYPLMIDPQLQGITWIKEKLKSTEFMILKLSKKSYAFDLERAIEDGQSVIIENLEDYIDPVLMPVIARNVIKRGNKRYMMFGGKQLDLHPSFRLYMQTKLSNPNYPPEVQAEAVLINFTVTEVGLGDQLLNFIVSKERPDLATRKKDLVLEQNNFKIQLKRLELDLLNQLNRTTGDATENITLIESLEHSKILASEIKEKVAKGQKTTEEINNTSEYYRKAATRGALIFFLMNDLYKMSSFYIYSLESFINVIERSVALVANKYKEERRRVDEKQHQQVASVQELSKERSEAKLDSARAGDRAEGEVAPPVGTMEDLKVSALDGLDKSKMQINIDDAENHEAPKTAANPDEPLTPRSLRKRVDELTESITYCSFSFVRRGLFEKHKLIFATMLCMKIMVSMKELKFEDYMNFIIPKKATNVNYPESESLKSYITEVMYKECKGLENSIEKYNGLCDSLLSEHLAWKKWIGTEKAEDEDLPSKSFSGVTKFQRLMLIKILRPDRVSYALKDFLKTSMGDRYIEQPPFNMKEVYSESNETSPIFFVLFPGVDPTPAVEELGIELGIVAGPSDGKGFLNISMGQGQEEMAKNEITKCATNGGWIFLQNVHLMQSWLKDLELKLEEIAPISHKNFRMFISSEPPPADLPTMQVIPEAILQKCIKVSNEAPADLKANMRRAFAQFGQAKIDASSKKNEYKSILFALCYFHAVVSGRKKFGNQGWSRVYNFNDGDLNICSDVLHNYLEKYEVVPYNDLIYIYGEIMYGGHITDDWDRRTNNTYLKKLITPKLLNQENLLPVDNKVFFRMLDPAKNQYEEYRNYIEKLPDETPLMFGMHPNAEINFLMNQTEFIFKCVVDLIGESGGSGGKRSDSTLKETVRNLAKETEANNYELIDLRDRINNLNKGDAPQPFQIVLMQECERMNQLVSVMVTTLTELGLGLDGSLNMTDAMESLSQSLNLNRVPPAWGAFYMSRRPLDSWFLDFKKRCEQLKDWSDKLVLPKPLKLSYLFNPMSFLTAIMQITARENGLPLDNMALVTRVTNFKDGNELIAFERKPVPEKKNKDEEEEDPEKKKKDEGGAYVDGFFLEGADWETGGSGEGYLGDQKLKVLHPYMPIIKVIAVPIEKKSMKGQYPCPVYYTTQRGPTYIFTANLNMESEEEVEEWKWILAGVALILNDDN